MYDEVPDLKEKFLLSDDIKNHWFVFQGNLSVPFIDYREEIQFANGAIDVFKDFQVSICIFFKKKWSSRFLLHFEDLIENVPGINASLLTSDMYVMSPEKDTLFRGEFEAATELVTRIIDGAGAQTNNDKFIDLNEPQITRGTSIKQLRENIAESELRYMIMDDADQTFLSNKIMDNIQK